MQNVLWLSPLIRIALRYSIGFLVAKGLISEVFGGLAEDSDVAYVLEIVVYIILAVIVETWYGLAKKYGWAK